MHKSIAVEDIKIGVVGAGSWGSALADLLARKGYPIDLWVFEKEVKDQILQGGKTRYFFQVSHLHPISSLPMIWLKWYRRKICW